MVREVKAERGDSTQSGARTISVSLLASFDELRVEGPEQSAAVIRAVLAGEEGPARRIVLANAAAALLAAEKATSLLEGVALAAEAIDSGRALEVLNKLVALSQGTN